jgi:UDP-GlcNAc:undecaprenyl-phosphate GlcNAc-1-phosphate transferase
MDLLLPILCLAAALHSAILVDLIRRAALGRGWLDRPHGRQGGPAYRAVPRIGGAGILGALLLGLAIGAACAPARLDLVALLVMGCVGVMVYAVGAVDDLRGVPAALKLAVLVGAAVASSLFSLRWEWLVGGSAAGAALALALGVAWLVAVPAAINFVDGLDGLAAGLCAVAAVAIAALGAVHGDATTTLIAAVLAAATLGFWHHNSHPARVFMGDGGAMLLGYLLAALSLRLLHTGGPAAFAAAAAALGWPLFDLALATFRRVRRRALFRGDAEHLHHRLASLRGHAGAVAWIHRMAVSLAAAPLLLFDRSMPLAVAALILVWSARWLAGSRMTIPRWLAAGAAAASLGLLLTAGAPPGAAPTPRATPSTAQLLARGVGSGVASETVMP